MPWSTKYIFNYINNSTFQSFNFDNSKLAKNQIHNGSGLVLIKNIMIIWITQGCCNLREVLKRGLQFIMSWHCQTARHHDKDTYRDSFVILSTWVVWLLHISITMMSWFLSSGRNFYIYSCSSFHWYQAG